MRFGGPAVGTVQMALALEGLGVPSTIFATNIATPPQGKNRRFGVRPEELPPNASKLNVHLFPVKHPRRLLYSPALRQAVQNRLDTFDVVHIHSLFLYPQYIAAKEARRRGIPYVVSPHGALDPYLRRRGRTRKFISDLAWQRAMFDGAALIHLTSEDEKRQVQELGLGNYHHVGPYGVIADDFRGLPPRQIFRDRFLNGFQGSLVLYHGRLSDKKGLDVLIQALLLVRELVPETRLAIVGGDDEGLGAKLRSQVTQLGLSEAIRFVGVQYGDDLKAALSAADVWAMPSQGENFGIAFVEALAAGCPTVVSNNVNTAFETAAAGACEVADRTPEAFGQTIAKLLGDPARRSILSTNARRFVRHFDWSSSAPQLKAMYEKALEK